MLVFVRGIANDESKDGDGSESKADKRQRLDVASSSSSSNASASGVGSHRSTAVVEEGEAGESDELQPRAPSEREHKMTSAFLDFLAQEPRDDDVLLEQATELSKQ